MVLSCVAALVGYGVLNRGQMRPAGARTKPFGPLQHVVSPLMTGMGPSAASGSTSKAGDDPRVEIEFCGLGKTAFHSDDELAAARYVGGLSKPVARRWLAALLNSDDNRARAAGMYLEGKIVGSALQPMAEQTREELIQLAVGSGDPAVYAIAVNACNTYEESVRGACEQISLSGWAAQAGKVDSYNFSLLAFAEPELPKDATPLEQWFLAIEAIGVEAAIDMHQYRIASKHCSAAAMQDSDVRKQCSDLAEVFATKGTNLLDLCMGTNLGARAGWSPARVAGLKLERDALMQVTMQAAPTGVDNQWTCGAVELGNAYLREAVQLGELVATREVLDRSGETVQELAKKWREFLENSRR
ncbi:MAG: hypothetical protein ABJC66_12210 [Gammaproteobacteria bacterium]